MCPICSFFFRDKIGGATRWRFCYQKGLLLQVFKDKSFFYDSKTIISISNIAFRVFLTCVIDQISYSNSSVKFFCKFKHYQGTLPCICHWFIWSTLLYLANEEKAPTDWLSAYCCGMNIILYNFRIPKGFPAVCDILWLFCRLSYLTQLATEFGCFFCQVQLLPANYSSKFEDRLPSDKKTSFN